ncbi:Protein FAM57A [Orchesella cincta]|uniref:Protein FAM57A n=1 Tax=Orchesella cincta TaxID=48709 RepID=A0A1D2NG18_ORCCI|nr:Protein FAM57A [Orchesella cincta]
MGSVVGALGLFLGGWLLFPGLFLAQLYFWSRTSRGKRLRKQYDLTEKDCSDITNKLVSAFQAVLATTTGVIVCSSCYNDVLHCSHPITLIYAWFGLPYFFYDTISMFYVSTIADMKPKDSAWKKFFRFVVKSPVIVIHHIVLAPVGFTLLVFFRDGVKNGDFFMGTVYLMEASTPFVCLRFILSKFRMKSSIWYAVNGLLMLVLFPVFRIVSLFYAAYLYGQQQLMSTFDALYEMPFGWKIVFFLAVAPQIYWYFLMWRGLVRMITKGTGPADKSKKFDDDTKHR